MTQAVLTFDVGTSSCKGALYSVPDGTQIAERSEGYGIQRPAPMWVEQQPEDWWTALQAVCRALATDFPAVEILGIGLTGQVPTMVLVDAQGKALAPAISWQDRRADAEAAWLKSEIGAEKLAAWLGLSMPIDAGWPPARLVWLARHRSDLIDATHKILMAKDYIACQMTGAFTSDPWSSKGLIDLLTGIPPADYYAALGLAGRETLAPTIVAPQTVVGGLSASAAAALGLRAGMPVVNGSSDAVCGMIGTGAVGMGNAAFNLTGTSEMIGRAGGAPTEGLLFIPASVIGGSPILYGPTQSGGDSLIWFAGFSASSFEAAVEAAAKAPAGSGGVVFLPYLAGERAPIWDSAARGAFLGLLRQQSFEHGARAVMEGVAFSVRHVLEVSGVTRTGVTPGADMPLRITGGSTRVPLWNGIRADVTGLTVEVVEQSATTLGAAMLTALGIGVFPSLNAAGAMVRIQERIEPQPANRQVYDDAYGRFRAAYTALRALNFGTQ